jgi:hypothetical protein
MKTPQPKYARCKWRHRRQSMPDTSEDTAAKVCYILKNKDAATKVFQILTSGDTATKIFQILTSEDTATKVCYILINKSPPPKCSRYSQVKALPPFSVTCTSHCLLEHLPTSTAEESRLQRLSSKHIIFLSHWSKEANCWCNEFWLTTRPQSNFQCNILIIKMYTESKITWTVGSTVRFYFRLCSMIYLFLTGTTNNWPPNQLTNQLTTHQVTNNHYIF